MLICVSLMTSEVEHFSTCVKTVFISSSVKCPLPCFAQFYWIFFIIELQEVKSLKYIFEG